jgi:hypothetical protein
VKVLSSFPAGGTGNGPMEKQIMAVTQLRSQVARDILEKVFSSYPVKNARSRVSFGSNKDGIHCAAVDDPMHYNSSGLFSYLAEIAFGGLKPKEAKMLERYMREDCKERSSIPNLFPRGKYSSGFLPTALYSLPLRKWD